jgi:hypothetical protein
MEHNRPAKCLILRAVLRDVSPMVIRVFSISDQVELPEFHRVFQAVLGWDGALGYLLRIHGREHNSRRRRARTVRLCDFRLHRQEKFLYASDMASLWEWDVRVLDICDSPGGADPPVCLRGRGTTPPQYCGGPTGYRLMLARQREGAAASDPALLEIGVQWFAATNPEAPAETWNVLRRALKEGWESVQPERFVLGEANERLAQLTADARFRP